MKLIKRGRKKLNFIGKKKKRKGNTLKRRKRNNELLDKALIVIFNLLAIASIIGLIVITSDLWDNIYRDSTQSKINAVSWGFIIAEFSVITIALLTFKKEEAGLIVFFVSIFIWLLLIPLLKKSMEYFSLAIFPSALKE